MKIIKLIINIIRLIVAVPVVLIGRIFFLIGEILLGEKITYRSMEVKEHTVRSLRKNMQCSICGHKGK